MAASARSMSPRLCLRSSVDWWALGVMFGEILLGEAPLPQLMGDDNLAGLSTLLTLYQKEEHIQPLPDTMSGEAAACLTALLTVPTALRITSVAALKSQPFFAGEPGGRGCPTVCSHDPYLLPHPHPPTPH